MKSVLIAAAILAVSLVATNFVPTLQYTSAAQAKEPFPVKKILKANKQQAPKPKSKNKKP
jgi:hypothetical protein